jgi:tetratricopeptide (TPR) repeat protein
MSAVLKETPAGREMMPELLQEAEKLRVERKPDEAMRLCNQYMDSHFDYVPALVLAANIMIDAERFGAAHVFINRACQLAPDESVVWNNIALCYQETEQPEEALKCFLKALNRNPNDTFALANVAKLYNNIGEPQKALNCVDKALRLNPKLIEARYNRGISLLALGQWKEGWEGYEYNLGKHSGRKERVFGRIPRWTGEPRTGMTLIAYGEQGIGDEINFASCIPDLKRDNEVIIECDKRLEGLFRRSFGGKVYGTRYWKGGLKWPTEYPIDATVAFGSLPGFYRNDLSEFPGTPFLTPDPLRCVAWRAVLDRLGPKLKVGITWTGGIRKTLKSQRSMALKDLEPILRQDATFISLQYKDATDECAEFEERTGIKVHHWPHATQTQDMDDQAALMAELDLVITVQQTAVHLGGALGVETWAMIPKAPLWRYGITGTTMPWYGSVKLYRQKEKWQDTIAQVAVDLRKKIAEKGISAAK